MTDGTRPVQGGSPPGPPEPAVGDTVHDTLRDRVGVVMAHEGPYVQLRPLGGGREWDADPARIRPLTPAELLSARVAYVNTRSRSAFGGDQSETAHLKAGNQ